MGQRRGQTRRTVIKSTGAVVGGLSLAGCTGGSGEGFPQRDIELIVPYGTAGGYNAYARLVAPYLEKHLPGPGSVQVENIEGAGGQVAMNTLATAEPDGYTQAIININAFTRYQLVFDTDYDVREFTYFSQVAESPQALAVSEESGITSWEEYVDRAQAGELKFAGEGEGTTSSLLGQMIGDLTGAYDFRELDIVHFDGKSGVVSSFLRGETHATGNPWDSLLEFVKQGDMRYLLLLMDEVPDAIAEVQSDVETLDDVDFDDEVTEQLGSLAHTRLFGGPPGMPDDVTETVREAYEAAINDEELKSEAQEMDRPVSFAHGDDVADIVATKYETWESYRDLLEDALA